MKRTGFRVGFACLGMALVTAAGKDRDAAGAAARTLGAPQAMVDQANTGELHTSADRFSGSAVR